MTAHRAHPIEGDPDDAILYDGCERCAQHAEYPLSGSLDADKLARLWRRMLEVELDPTYLSGYRTGTEAMACRTLNQVAMFVEATHPSIDVWSWPWHWR